MLFEVSASSALGRKRRTKHVSEGHFCRETAHKREVHRVEGDTTSRRNSHSQLVGRESNLLNNHLEKHIQQQTEPGTSKLWQSVSCFLLAPVCSHLEWKFNPLQKKGNEIAGTQYRCGLVRELVMRRTSLEEEAHGSAEDMQTNGQDY